MRSLESGDAENVGATKAAQDEKQWMTAIQLGAASLVRTAAQLGIDVNVSSTGTNSSVGIAVPSILTVGAFSFSSGGSTFEVKPDENGNLIGTKDGQAWNTWQLNNFTAGQPVGTSEADIALQALSSFTSSGGVSNNKTLTAVPLASPTSVNVAV